MTRSKKVVEFKVGVSGRFKLVSHKADAAGNIIPGTAVERTDWIDNLITNRGLNALGDEDVYGNFMRGCTVGTGSTAPAFTDTALVSRVANAATTDTTWGQSLGTTPKFVYTRRTYRFGAGVATGTLAEVGLVAALSDGSSANGALNAATPLSTRALIVDGGGTPTTITILSDEVLDVIYEVRMNIPAADVTGTVNIGGVDHDYIVRPWRIDTFPGVNTGGWALPNANAAQLELMDIRQSSGHGENAIWCGSGAELTSDTGAAPTGTKVGGDNAGMTRTLGAYTADTHYRDCTQSFSLGANGTYANQSGGIGVHSFAFRWFAFQVNLAPHVLKDHTKTYSLTMRVSWARA